MADPLAILVFGAAANVVAAIWGPLPLVNTFVAGFLVGLAVYHIIDMKWGVRR